MEITKFDELNLDEGLLKALIAIDYLVPSPIQAKAIPVALTGVDIIGQAQTGTGKTAAFGIPMIQNISKDGRYTKGLVLCPTRELCIQVTNELKKLAHYTKNVTVFAIYGGDPITPQIRALRAGVDIVVGTPGRVMDHIGRGTLQLDQLEMLALDEADEMLNMGFREDLEHILTSVPEERQTILFSATMPKAIMDITHIYQKNPQLIKVTPAQLTAINVEQFFIDTDMKSRLKALIFLLSQDDYSQAIVFCNTKAKVDELSNELAENQIKNDVLHGDLSQEKRNRILNKFRKGEFKVLVATDVAARGIDVPNVDLVCNYDISFDPEYYVHRVGRTGRAGKEGKAYSFVAGARDKRLLRQIEDFAKVRVEKYKLPEAKDVAKLEVEKLKKQVTAIIEANQEKFYIDIAKDLIPEGASETQVLAALMVKLMPPSKHDWMKPSGGNNPYVRGEGGGGRDRDRGDRGGRGDGGGRDRGRGGYEGGGRDDRRSGGRRDDRSSGGERRYSGGSERSFGGRSDNRSDSRPGGERRVFDRDNNAGGERRSFDRDSKPERRSFDRPAGGDRKFGSDRPKYGNDRPKFGDDKPRYGDVRPRFGDDRPKKFGDDRPKFGDKGRDYKKDDGFSEKKKPASSDKEPSLEDILVGLGLESGKRGDKGGKDFGSKKKFSKEETGKKEGFYSAFTKGEPKREDFKKSEPKREASFEEKPKARARKVDETPEVKPKAVRAKKVEAPVEVAPKTRAKKADAPAEVKPKVVRAKKVEAPTEVKPKVTRAKKADVVAEVKPKVTRAKKADADATAAKPKVTKAKK